MSSLIVVRNGINEPDAMFQCVGHTSEGNYAAVHVDEQGNVIQRDILFRRADAEELMNKYDTVYADDRDVNGLAPLTIPRHALPPDFESYRRAKSEEEKTTLQDMHSASVEYLSNAIENGNNIEAKFCGAGKSDGNKTFFDVHEHDGFTQYTGGMRNEQGLCSNVAIVVPQTEPWIARTERVFRGMEAGQRAIRAGATPQDIASAVREHLHPVHDFLCDDCIDHIGYGGVETYKNTTLREHDVVSIALEVSDAHGDVAMYRSGPEAVEKQLQDVRAASRQQFEETRRDERAAKDLSYDIDPELLKEREETIRSYLNNRVKKQARKQLELEEQSPPKTLNDMAQERLINMEDQRKKSNKNVVDLLAEIKKEVEEELGMKTNTVFDKALEKAMSQREKAMSQRE